MFNYCFYHVDNPQTAGDIHWLPLQMGKIKVSCPQKSLVFLSFQHMNCLEIFITLQILIEVSKEIWKLQNTLDRLTESEIYP